MLPIKNVKLVLKLLQALAAYKRVRWVHSIATAGITIQFCAPASTFAQLTAKVPLALVSKATLNEK